MNWKVGRAKGWQAGEPWGQAMNGKYELEMIGNEDSYKILHGPCSVAGSQ